MENAYVASEMITLDRAKYAQEVGEPEELL